MTVHDTGRFNEGHDRAKAMLAGARLQDQPGTDDQIDRATRHVATHAHDADDCRNLLEALGLIDPGFAWVRVGRARRRKVES